MEKIVVVGSLNMDLVIHVPHIPAIGETILAKKVSYSAGGKGANQSVAAARLGGDVHMIGRLGKDDHGKALHQGLQESGVQTEGIVFDAMTSTGMAFINVSQKGENNIVVNPGANGQLAIEQIQTHEAVFDGAGYCIVQLEIPLETVAYVYQLCRRKNIRFILNPAPAIPIDLNQFKHSYLIAPNEAEINMLVAGNDSIEKKAQIVYQLGFQNVLVTLGKSGCLLVNGQGSQYFEARDDFNAVDTTGAGDAFIGGLTVSLAEGMDMKEAIRFATVVAGIAVSRPGAQPSLPERSAVEAFL